MLAGHDGASRLRSQTNFLILRVPQSPQEMLKYISGEEKTGSDLLAAGFGWCGVGPPSSPCLRSAAFASSRCLSESQAQGQS